MSGRADRGGAHRRIVPLLGFLTLTAAVTACSGATKSGEDTYDPVPETPGANVAQSAQEDLQAALPLGPVSKNSLREHPGQQAWILEGEAPVQIEVGQAEARGYTVVDLSDDWTPYIFSDKTPGLDDRAENTYATRYVDLANNRTDSDGDPLAEHEQNHLELYGIPPTLSVIQEEWAEVETLQACLDEAGHDFSAYGKHPAGIGYRAKQGDKRVKKAKWLRAKLAKDMKRARLAPDDFAGAAEHPKTKQTYASLQEHEAELGVIENAQIRFRCEQLYRDKTGRGRFSPGVFDGPTHHALAKFERKHNIMGWGHFTEKNIAALQVTPEDSAHQRLQRVITARVVSAAGILEDGSAADWKPDFRWKDGQGREHPLRDLTTEMSEAAFEALGMADAKSARAALERIDDLDGKPGFDGTLVAIKLPPVPEYYSDDMDFETVIDRGDVWYDFPYDDEGNRRGQPRRRFPKLTLYVNYEGQRIPLVHWRTTIGSWRSEEVDGQEYFKYKNSDVGERVWKDIMAAPTWIPPASTPTRSLVKRKYKDGQLRTVVNYDETGPSYKSAYGLVAAYHIRQVERKDGTVAEIDNQIRTHGSVDYMSILRRYSHGCHRLYNMNAVRMFSFILRHRAYTRHGQKHVGFRRTFEHQGIEHRMALDTRGYQYELVEPIPVVVTEGRIRGSRKRPYTDYRPKPGVIYDETEEESTSELTETTSSPLDLP